MNLWEKMNTLESKHDRILDQLTLLTQEIRKMAAATQADIDALLATINTDLAALQTANQTVIDTLRAITPGLPAPNFTNEIAQLTAIDNALQALKTSDVNAVTTNPPAGTPLPTPTPAPTPAPAPATSGPGTSASSPTSQAGAPGTATPASGPPNGPTTATGTSVNNQPSS